MNEGKISRDSSSFYAWGERAIIQTSIECYGRIKRLNRRPLIEGVTYIYFIWWAKTAHPKKGLSLISVFAQTLLPAEMSQATSHNWHGVPFIVLADSSICTCGGSNGSWRCFELVAFTHHEGLASRLSARGSWQLAVAECHDIVAFEDLAEDSWKLARLWYSCRNPGVSARICGLAFIIAPSYTILQLPLLLSRATFQPAASMPQSSWKALLSQIKSIKFHVSCSQRIDLEAIARISVRSAWEPQMADETPSAHDRYVYTMKGLGCCINCCTEDSCHCLLPKKTWDSRWASIWW